MKNEKQETIADIVAQLRAAAHIQTADSPRDVLKFSERIEAAAKRKADSIHREMVIIAGIEMENSDDPPRLWTALEDAYDALSDAMGTDGETTADVEEAKTTGRHFVVKPFGNTAAMREALNQAQRVLHCAIVAGILGGKDAHEALNGITAALSAPPRNCDVGTIEEQAERFCRFCLSRNCCDCPFTNRAYGECGVFWSQMPYEEGGAK